MHQRGDGEEPLTHHHKSVFCVSVAAPVDTFPTPSPPIQKTQYPTDRPTNHMFWHPTNPSNKPPLQNATHRISNPRIEYWLWWCWYRFPCSCRDSSSANMLQITSFLLSPWRIYFQQKNRKTIQFKPMGGVHNNQQLSRQVLSYDSLFKNIIKSSGKWCFWHPKLLLLLHKKWKPLWWTFPWDQYGAQNGRMPQLQWSWLPMITVEPFTLKCLLGPKRWWTKSMHDSMK